MKNTHLEHPEDHSDESRCSAAGSDFPRARFKDFVKWDGAPAIVFGYNSENQRRFVGTKSSSINARSNQL